MKKAFLILLAFAMVGAAFAADVVAPTLSGSVSATWGYDLDAEAGGFKNDNSVVVTFPFAAFGNKAQGGSGMYGEIIVEDFGLKFDNDTSLATHTDGGDADNELEAETNNLVEGGDYDVTAIIHFNEAVYAKIYSAPDFDSNFAVNYKADAGNTVADVNVNSRWVGEGKGIEFGYKTDMIAVALKVSSKSDYDAGAGDAYVAKANTPWSVTTLQEADGADTSQNVDNLYAYQGVLMLKPVEMLTVDAVFTMIPEDFAFAGVSVNAFDVKAVATIAPLTITVASDIVMFSEEMFSDVKMVGDLAGTVSYKVIDGFDVAANVWAAFSDTAEDTDMPLNFKLTLTEALATGFVPNLGATVTFKLEDLLGDNDADDEDFEYFIDAELSYLVMAGVTAMADVGYGWDEKTTFGASVAMGPDFHKIANTTFTVKYDDFARVDGGDVDGVVTFTAKIAF